MHHVALTICLEPHNCCMFQARCEASARSRLSNWSYQCATAQVHAQSTARTVQDIVEAPPSECTYFLLAASRYMSALNFADIEIHTLS